MIKSTKKDAVINELKKIEDRDQIITPLAVVKVAQDETNPLHPHFEWDDQVAAAGYRLWQARELVNSYEVEIKGKNQEAFHSVLVEINGVRTRGYVSTERIVTSKDLQDQVKQAALREIVYWQQKYKNIQELVGIVDTEKLKQLQATV